jgi:hypothetical protein
MADKRAQYIADTLFGRRSGGERSEPQRSLEMRTTFGGSIGSTEVSPHRPQHFLNKWILPVILRFEFLGKA